MKTKKGAGKAGFSIQGTGFSIQGTGFSIQGIRLAPINVLIVH